jgi:hypothetical protein
MDTRYIVIPITHAHNPTSKLKFFMLNKVSQVQYLMRRLIQLTELFSKHTI